MRTGRGAMHEEFWETRDDRRTSIELFQIWVNLPGRQKMDPPAIRHLGPDWGAPWRETAFDDSSGRRTTVRAVLDDVGLDRSTAGEGGPLRRRPKAEVLHATLDPGAVWTPRVGAETTAMLYCRTGPAAVPAGPARDVTVAAGESCYFARGPPGAAAARIANPTRAPVDVLLFVGDKLREPVATGGPIVMNTNEELDVAFAQLRAGTFLDGGAAPS